MTGTDPQTIVLYALTAFAPTCTALAAFLGSVGLRVQSMRDESVRIESTLRVEMARHTFAVSKAQRGQRGAASRLRI